MLPQWIIERKRDGNELSEKEFFQCLETVGCSITGQTAQRAPTDKKLDESFPMFATAFHCVAAPTSTGRPLSLRSGGKAFELGGAKQPAKLIAGIIGG